MLTPSRRLYRPHVENYVIEHFQHLMTDRERWALSGGGSLSEMVSAQALLHGGVADFRSDVTERLESTHRAEIYAKACPICKRLPAPPKAKHCVWCSGDWYESRLDRSPAALEAPVDAETGLVSPHLYLTEAEKEHIRKTDNARYMDWILEIEGQPFGLLTDCHFVDMFWYNYQFTFISDNAELKTKFQTREFSYNSEKHLWRNQKYGIAADYAWASGTEAPVTGERITVRAMVIIADPRTPPEPGPEPKNTHEKMLRWLKLIVDQRKGFYSGRTSP